MLSPSVSRASVSSECLAEHLERPALDDRSYKVIRLSNKLEALLIHDPDTDKASAALDVNAGSFSDADDMPGMAHAVEHLLFMGTEKYPKENDYNTYLKSHAGYSNAFTAATSTNYFFEVAASSSGAAGDNDGPPPLYGALDRFAQFFIAPLFLEETLDRELRAVDSENKKNLQSDMWRLYQLSKTLSNPKHPYCHFSTGSLQTLRDEPVARGVKIRDEFMAFHNAQYSANRMKLVVLGRESLDQLQLWVEDLFADVRNKNLPQNRWDGISPYGQGELLKQVFAKPVMESRSLDIVFPYQDEEDMFETQPGRYLSHLVGHEGPGSILSYIKGKGWANSLSAGASDVCPGSAFFSIQVKLTSEGLKCYKEVTKAIFQYLALVRETPPQEWIFNEVKIMTEVDFRFRQKSPASRTTSALSGVMQKPLPRSQLLSGQSLIRRFDSGAISRGIAYLRPDNFRLTVVSQDPLPGDVKKEKWYGTEYSVEDIPDDFLAELKQISTEGANHRPGELHLPHKNEFIPARLDVERKDIKDPAKSPRLIRNDSSVRLWFKKDDQFWVPKANLQINLRNPICGATARSAVLTSMVVELVKDSLDEYSYDAEIAGLEYDLQRRAAGIEIDLSGYNDRMPVLLEKVLTSLRNLQIKEERFDIIHERVTRSYRNHAYNSPYQQVGSYTQWLANDHGFIVEERLVEMASVTIEDVRAFVPAMLGQFHIEALVHGNLYQEDALKMADLVERILRPRTLPGSQWPVRRSVLFSPGSNVVYHHNLKDLSNVNHCIEYSLNIGDIKDRERYAQLLLLAQMTDEPAFDQLRTQEQLGYVVFSGPSLQATTAGYRILIQSEKTCAYLEERIDAFLNTFKKDLVDMSEQEFESHKLSVINRRLEKVKNLNQETGRFWQHISNEYYHFEQVYNDVEHIKPLTQEGMINFFETYIDPASATRSKLSVHLIAQGGTAETNGSVADGSDAIANKKKAFVIENVRSFKASLPLTAGPSPFTDLIEYEDLASKL